MAIKVGMPRGLLFYKYGTLWKSFLENLGAEVIISPKTNKRMFTDGAKLADSELCAPVKVYYGHSLALASQVDRLVIPRIVSTEKKTYTCPKFLGIPDLIRAIDHPLPEIEGPVFDRKLGVRAHYRTILDWGRRYISSDIKILKAWRSAVAADKKFQDLLRQGYLPDEVITGEMPEKVQVEAPTTKVAIVGHPYNIFDNFISLNIVSKLRKRGIGILTPEMLSHSKMTRELTGLPKDLFWSYEKEILGSAFYWLRRHEVDGVIYVLSFACGPDSLIQVLIEKEAKEHEEVPLMSVVIDEHSGEAGLMTRIEAFLDMIEFRKNKQHMHNDTSAAKELIHA